LSRRRRRFNPQKLLAREKEGERKEKRAERAERIFLAEEQQEKKILQQKSDAARTVSTVTVVQVLLYCTSPETYLIRLLTQEENKFERVEKEYERVAGIAKEDEAELRYVLFETSCLQIEFKISFILCHFVCLDYCTGW